MIWDDVKMTREDFVKLPLKERLELYRQVKGHGLFDKCTPSKNSLLEMWFEENAERETIRYKYPQAVI